MRITRLQDLVDSIKEKAIENLEDVDGNGEYDVCFYFQQKEALIEVNAVIEVTKYYYSSGNWEQPSEQDYDSRFLNAFVNPLFNAQGVELTNVTNELNKLLK